MSFSTKVYTRPVLLNNLKKLKTTDFVSASALASALSPRAGRKSAQFAALNKLVKINSIIGQYSNPLLSRKIIMTTLSSKKKTLSVNNVSVYSLPARQFIR